MAIRPGLFRWMVGSLVAAPLLLSAAPASAASWIWVQEGTELRYLRGTAEPPAGWSAFDFAPGAEWTTSTPGFGIGYGDGDDATLLSDMVDSYLTVYVRSHFTVGAELSSLTHVELSAQFDDGFVAYLNGTEIARSSLPAGSLLSTTAATAHEVTDGVATFVVEPSLLRAGDNVLAVEVHNSSLGSSDLSFIPQLWGYDTEPPTATITRGPFVQQVGRESAIVVWETSAAAPSELWYGESADMPLRAQDAAESTRHVVTLTGLLPAREYFYQVQSAQVPSAVGRIVTEVNRADPFVVGVFGDTRSGHETHRAIADALATHQPHLAFLTGDLVADGSIASQWDTFCDVESNLIRNTSLYPSLGNHEGSGALYLDLFELPTDSPAPERYFAVRYGTVLGIALDQYGSDYDAGSEQALWLEQVLADSQADPNIRHRLISFHHSPYDSGPHGSNMTVRSDLVPLFEQYGVSMVFAGHDHHYERATVNGIKYIVTGGGGAGLYSDFTTNSWTEVIESVNHYCTLAVHGPRLEFTAYLVDGTVLDSFVLGDDVAECTSSPDTECSSFPDQSCAEGETGSWACVEGACIYNCVSDTPPPPPPDGGTGGSGTGGQGSGASGGAGQEPPLVPSSGAGDESSCGCRMVGAAPGGAALWAAAAGLGLLGVRRRRRR